jgi:hypothetical protein
MHPRACHCRALRAAEQPAIDATTAEMAALERTRAEATTSLERLKAGIEQQRHALEELRNAGVSRRCFAGRRLHSTQSTLPPPPHVTTAAVRRRQSALDFRIAGGREDLEERRGHIVASPARLKAEVDAVARMVEDTRGMLASREGETTALARRAEVVAKAGKDLGKVMALLADLDVSVSMGGGRRRGREGRFHAPRLRSSRSGAGRGVRSTRELACACAHPPPPPPAPRSTRRRRWGA